MKLRSLLLALTLTALASSPVWAHPLPGSAAAGSSGFAAGFAHPWCGLDHVLAMLAVGLLAVQRGGRALWVLPAAFLGAMIVGGALGLCGLPLPGVEWAIALSVVALGAALATARKFSLFLAALVIGACGLFHGHAHGCEVPSLAAPVLYVAGFTLATALLHGLGIAGGLAAGRRESWQLLLRCSGAAISLAGLALLIGAV